jgi:PAS domain-containing protein
MAVTFWNIPGIQSHKSLEVLERSLSPICVYSELGQTIYASQSFLKLLPVAEAVDFLGCFSSESTSKAVLKSYWGRALQGETVDFLASYGDVRQEIECSLQFNPDAKLMFLTVKKAGSDGDTCRLINEYERAVALFDRSSLATALINPEGAIIKCNEQFHSLLGTSDREIIQLE